MKFLSTDDIYLKKLSSNDNLDNYLEMVNDVEELFFIDDLGRYPLNNEDIKHYINNISGLFLGIFNQDNEHVGNIRVTQPHPINRHCQLGILINKKFRGKGVGKKAIDLVINHIFLNLNINRVELYVDEENKYAIKMYKEIGFVKEGIKRELVWKNGKYHNYIIYSIIAKDFFKKTDYKEEK